ncbi:acyltransferase family protein [Cellulomonas endophytica]|uniref:acyltransferase family protein n=1 Tax=Cellulomonas endophytica TaxID=2494735 RepID=UPI00196B0BCB|nr:acyltransferase family protein [Cellulomonas endophytica]
MTATLTGPGAPTGTAPAGAATTRPAPAGALPAAGRGGRWRADVQGLRAVAVLLVVLYHAGVPGVGGGYVGVDAFFVVSGFLITGHLLRDVERHGRVRLRAFWAARIRRLAPMAVLVVVVTAVAFRVWGPVFALEALARDAALATLSLLNVALALDGVDYGQAGGPESPLMHYWSLAVEEQFYLVWPLLVTACAVLARRWWRPAVGAALVLVVAVSFAASVGAVATGSPFAYFSLHTRAWELGVGGLLAVLAPLLPRVPGALAAAVGWAGLAALVAAGLVLTDRTPFPGTAALLPVLATAAVLVAGEGERGRRLGPTRLLAARPLQGLGAISYGWYLWHWPLLVLLPQLVSRSLPWTTNLQLVVLTAWLATLSFWLVERPARALRLPPRRWLAVGAVLAATGLVAAAGVRLTVPDVVGRGAVVVPVEIDGADTAALAAQVSASTGTRLLPANLDPALAVARGDQPDSSRDGCHAPYEAVDQPPCVYGDPAGTRTVVLLGDSHAQQWLPGLAAAAATTGWRAVAWTKSACSVADLELWNADLRRTYTECPVWRERTLARVVAAAPDLVVVSQSDTVPGEQVGPAEWGEATARSLAVLRDAGIPVVLLLDTPYPGLDVPECLADHLTDVGACAVAREDVVPYEERRAAIEDMAAGMGVTAVDPADWMCTATTCPPVVGNRLVYRDISHITATYSTWLAPMLEPLVPAGG